MAVATDLRKAVQEYLESFLAYVAETEIAERLMPIIDPDRGHYLLYEIGHHNGEWIYTPWLHLRIDTADQIWIYCNHTDIPIAEELIERGVPKASILIGWIEPESSSAK